MAKSTLHFEQAMKELETIVAKLENPDCSLTNALDYFEKGIALMKVCDTQLKSAEGRLTELLSGKNGEFIEKTIGISSEDLSQDNEND